MGHIPTSPLFGAFTAILNGNKGYFTWKMVCQSIKGCAPKTRQDMVWVISLHCYNQNNGHSQKYDSAFLRSFWFTVCSSIFRPRADAVFSLSPPFFGTGRTLSDLKDSYLLVPQNKLPCIVTSRRCHFGGGLDIKKAESYYSVRHWNYACKK